MAVLRVFKDGQKLKELEVQAGKEWIVGRSSSSDLVLDGERGISRQHLRLFYEEGRWKLEILSRYGELYQNGNRINSLELTNGTSFEVPPFAFSFEDAGPTMTEQEVVSTGSFSDISARTMVGHFSMAPYLKVCDAQDSTVQVFQLDGHAWVAGRDTSCALFIDKQEFSRRHFEIRFEEGAYLIKDLESSNGTLLNDEVVSTTSWTQLKSGDVITVVDWKIYFELRDSAFEQRLQEIPADLQNPIYLPQVDVNPNSMGPVHSHTEGHPRVEEDPPVLAPKKINIVRILIGVLIVIGLASFLMQGSGGSTNENPQIAKSSSPFEKLTPQQQQYVKDTYRLADRLFKEGRYEMSRQEVAKIHQLIPSFEESKNLEKLADIAIQTQIEQQKADVREKEKQEMEEKIQRTVAECQKKVRANIEMQTIDDCLLPVLPLNPDHPAILALKARVDQLIAERNMRNEKRAEYQSLVRRQRNLYDKAESILKAGKPLDAIAAYGVVASSKLPDPQALKVQAKRQIASLQKQLGDKQSELEKEADQAAKKGDLKTAILTLHKAIDINPENETLRGQANSMLSELKKQMQVLYQEGVLEESVGEIETAKAKWKKILETSLPEEDYYKKAKIKLKKYVAE